MTLSNLKTTIVNNASVFVLNNDWSKGDLISLAVNSTEFTIEHEQEANYGLDTIFTLNDGLWVYLSELTEHQVEDEGLGDRFGLAFVKTINTYYDREYNLVSNVRYWKVECFDSENEESERDEEALIDWDEGAAA